MNTDLRDSKRRELPRWPLVVGLMLSAACCAASAFWWQLIPMQVHDFNMDIVNPLTEKQREGLFRSARSAAGGFALPLIVLIAYWSSAYFWLLRTARKNET
jgi:hypothetical protein